MTREEAAHELAVALAHVMVARPGAVHAEYTYLKFYDECFAALITAPDAPKGEPTYARTASTEMHVAAPDPATEREAFEKWAKARFSPLADVGAVEKWMHEHWPTWQARAATPAGEGVVVATGHLNHDGTLQVDSSLAAQVISLCGMNTIPLRGQQVVVILRPVNRR